MASSPTGLLKHYQLSADDKLSADIAVLLAVLGAGDDCLSRSRQAGHIVASAWVVSPDRKRVLLTHHRKLSCWIYLGGHADGDPDLMAVAHREVQEESGLSARFLATNLFDFDQHTVPATPTVPEHIHYDFRFLMEANPWEPLIVSDESHDVRWFPISGMTSLNPNFGIPRMVAKMSYWPL